MINGTFYGLYVVEEDVGRGVVKRSFPATPTVICGAGARRSPRTNSRTSAGSTRSGPATDPGVDVRHRRRARDP
jgi:hypothetical protein